MMHKRYFRNFIGVIIIAFIVLNFVPTTYFIISPGIAQELSPMVTVKDGYKGQSQGAFMLTAVASQRAYVWDYVYIKLRKPKGVKLEPMEAQLPQGMDMKDYLEIMSRMMEDSKMKAQAVAFDRVGYQLEIEGKGAVINEVLETSPAVGSLEKGDIIIAVDDKTVAIDDNAVKLIKAHEIGDKVKITVKRGEEVLDYYIETIETEDNPGVAVVGVMIFTDYEYQFPRKVSFQTANIAGPSAGSMFTLEIYNQLTAEDITRGRRIAGTGTIALDGSIGRIDGVTQKVITAERNAADIFLVPVENYEEAEKVAHNLTLVPVSTIDEAINYLQ